MYKLLKDSLKIRRYLLVTILVIQFISVILSTLLPYMNGMFVDMLIDIKNVEEVIKYAITIAGVGIISLFLSYIYNLKIMKVRKEDEIYGVISIVNGKVYINQTSFIGKIVLTKSFNQQVLKDFIGSVLINYKNEVKKDSKKIRISFENKDTEIYKELIQSLIELSFIKVAELKDELTIGQDVLIYDYFY